MTILKKMAVLTALLVFATSAVWAQCTNWNEIDNKSEAEDAHVIYRPYLKDKTVAELQELSASDFELAFTNWKKAYSLAPAADGGRPTHYIDGILLYQAKSAMTEDTEEKAAYAQRVMMLYDQYLECYPKDSKLILGRKAFDMFYSYGYGYTLETLEAIQKAMDAAGDDTEYILLDPLGQTLVYLYTTEQIDKETVQTMYQQAKDIAEHNIENDHPYKDYYQSGKDNMDAKLAEIAKEVFDCSYFVEEYRPIYEENKEDWETVNYIWQTLLKQGCDENAAEIADIKLTYETLKEIEMRKNPCVDGLRLQQEGKYDEALARYQECVETTEDVDVKAQILYSMASILTWQKGQYGSANAKLREALSIKDGWGKPYMLMGDIIAKRSQACDDWNRRLAAIAAIDKYSYARSIDSSVSEDASSRIGRLSGSLPSTEDIFSRGLTKGSTVTVSCIGETVKLRTRD
jgi:tetratricopeptide (TPR) repeat protein